MAYDFSTLDSNDFELLSLDIVNATFKLDLQSFKSGKDKGIDLRYSTPENNNAIVVQAKHWLKSGFSKLFREFETKELPKITALNPDRYIVVTSISLSAAEKDKVVTLLSPYLKTANDIIGREDLNKYLAELPELEKRWYKLWLTSVPVLQSIIHNGILGANDFVASKILRTTQLYVPCPSYDIAFEILKEHKYLLITGQPGVGKTTLAYYLTYNLLANGFQLLHVDTDISQASILLNADPTVKQVVFFDDFLGETYLEVNRPKTTESAFVLFLERITALENKYLILTTRTTIYNNALGKYEKMERMKVDVARREIVLDQYTILDKARILQKHIYFTEIPDEFKEVFVSDKNYWKIIEHKNYNPRLIEFVTSKRHFPKGSTEDYFRFVLNTLNNPKEVWKYFYQEQLSVEERILLHIVFAQSYSATADDTKQMFAYMLEYEARCFNYRQGLSPFQTACKRLLDGILKMERFAHNTTGRISFCNPSLADFLKYYFINSVEERNKLLNGSSTVEQFEHYKQNFLGFELMEEEFMVKESSWFANLLLDRAGELYTYKELKREKIREKYIGLRISAILYGIKADEETKKRIAQFVFDAIINYTPDNLSSESREFYTQALWHGRWGSDLYNYIVKNFETLINCQFRACISETDFEEVKYLFEEFNQDFTEYIKDKTNVEVLSECLNELANEQTMDEVSDKRSSVFSVEDWDELKISIIKSRRVIFESYSLNDEMYYEDEFFNDGELGEIIAANEQRINSRGRENITNLQKSETVSDENLVKEVELLFNGYYDPAFIRKKAQELDLPY
ncbi:MAG: hypothetical protein J0M10_03830 [Chitinophagales bacterium]|nr:hypothetical protein [Chitinophagales bacterium]